MTIQSWLWLAACKWCKIQEIHIHLIQKRLSSELLHCALLHTQIAKHHGCNEFVHCCMPRPQSNVIHISSMASTRMSLSHRRYLQCYFKICYIHGALRSGYATIRNAQCNNSEDNLFLIRCIQMKQNIFAIKALFYIQQLYTYAASRNCIYSTSRKQYTCYLSRKILIHSTNIDLFKKVQSFEAIIFWHEIIFISRSLISSLNENICVSFLSETKS